MAAKRSNNRFSMAALLAAMAAGAAYSAFGLVSVRKWVGLMSRLDGDALAIPIFLISCFLLLFVPGVWLIMHLLAASIKEIGATRPEERYADHLPDDAEGP
jgi:hypothetical protein